MNTGDHLPQLGAADPAALDYINSVWDRIPDDVLFRRYGLDPVPLKDLIRREADAIRLQARFRETVVAAVEAATGIPRDAAVRR